MSRRRPAGHPAPSLPTVNLLSPAAFELIAVRQLRRQFVLAGVALLVLLVALTGFQHKRVLDAEGLVDRESVQTAKLTGEVNELMPVQTYVSGVRAQVAALQATMMGEIWFSSVFTGLQDALPESAKVDTLTVALADLAGALKAVQAADGGEVAEDAVAAAVASPCPGPDPFNLRLVVGCVSIAGTAASRAAVGELVIALGENGLFVEPFITTTTSADSTGVAFSGSVGLSEKVFSGQYVDLADELFDEKADK
ncbi:hypothetical protein [Nocardioides ochotonae]|uniref:hypothetical protein n=1 Tax=Nocardioides ochotonae TaxID=2685869 RepID=UPI00140A0356|nr:hypothetical protein [Nocardioides ochotonae]